MEKSKRIGAEEKEILQVMRGFGIVAVVAYHAMTKLPGNFILSRTEELIDFFHVTIFFAIAGFLFEANRSRYKAGGFGKFLKGKLKRIFLPYYLSTVLFSAAIAVAAQIPALSSVIANGEYLVKNWFSILTDPLWYHEPLFRSLWFSWCLFWFFIVSWFFHPKCFFRKQSFPVVACGFYVVNTLFQIANEYGLIHAQYIWERLLEFYFFFYLGQYVFSRFQNRLPMSRRMLLFASVGACAVALRKFCIILPKQTVLLRAVDMAESMVFAMSCITLLLAVSMKLQGFPKKHMIFLGDESYPIYILNSPWIIPFAAVAMKKLTNNSLLTFFVLYLLGMYLSVFINRLYQAVMAKLHGG